MLLICLAFAFSVSLRLGNAQDPSLTSTSAVPTHTVSVGAAGLVFTPDTISASVGDVIEYRFYPSNHSVARADFESPCIPYEFTGPGRVGFWSGFNPLNVIPSNPPSFQITVNDTAPIFFYCSAPGACQQDGMVGVINPNETQTLDVQKAYAHNATVMFSPGESFPKEEVSSKSPSVAPTSTSSVPSSSTAAATTSTTPTSTTTPTAVAATSSKPALSGGAIAGIAIGGGVVIILAGALIYLCGRQRTLGEMVQSRNTQPHPHNSPHPPPTYMSGHLSLASATTYPPKTPKYNAEGLGPRYSEQAGYYDRAATETESYRSRSPPVDEGGEFTLPIMHSPASPGSGGRRMVPDRPSPVSPMEEMVYQPLTADVPAALRVDRYNSHGPHELDVESGRDYYSYDGHQHPNTGHGRSRNLV